MNLAYEYFNRMLFQKNMIIKVMDADLTLIPEMDTQNGMIGFRCNAEADAQGMKGRIDIKASFVMPETSTIEFTALDENLRKIIDNLEFIKATDRYPMNETIDSIILKEKK